ncbi:histidine phosphatase family protein [Bifidobacterium sp. ESL0769]|uniref:histidine phosphatase family protein n=1 Tax=Bifidobacterium sp. ESL0769 TaxID=2983229 RepID=UPI0023F84A18|nr:histidine phosphatase family protein [Bifidobacterium sp. ESL0769]WEV67193.1 histidine phosphatase family protein [Bifidobacterium sp. ESL0769]
MSEMNNTEPVTIYLARHTKTTSNAMGRMQGWSDFPVTPEGREIIRCFGRGLKGITFKAAWCGTLQRHYETARGALDYSGNESVSITRDADLREANFGSFEGRDINASVQAAMEELGYASLQAALDAIGTKANLDLQDGLYALDQRNVLGTDLDDEDRAESSEQIQDRMLAAMTRIGQSALAQGGGNVLVVSSGLSLREFLFRIDPEVDLSDQGNTATTKLRYADGRFTIIGPVGSTQYYERGRE